MQWVSEQGQESVWGFGGFGEGHYGKEWEESMETS